MLVTVARAHGQSQTTVVDSAAERAALGRRLFEGKGLCFSCHGKNGEGVLAPSTRLVGRTLVHTKVTVADISALIKTGVDSAHSSTGQVMPARGGSRLTDSEVESVARYVVEMQRREKPR
jgi:mono/diheme cytochrome c family protein